MKRAINFFLAATLPLLCSIGLSAQEISLFNSDGDAVAYIADDMTIYLWGGDPVAYLNRSSGTWHVYGFNGSHLGWYEDGIIYNHRGDAVGAQENATSMITSIEGIKSIKSIKPIKSVKEMAPMKPMFSSSWSRTPLVIFLRAGED